MSIRKSKGGKIPGLMDTEPIRGKLPVMDKKSIMDKQQIIDINNKNLFNITDTMRETALKQYEEDSKKEGNIDFSHLLSMKTNLNKYFDYEELPKDLYKELKKINLTDEDINTLVLHKYISSYLFLDENVDQEQLLNELNGLIKIDINRLNKIKESYKNFYYKK